MTKQCRKCLKVLPASDFNVDKRRLHRPDGGLYSYCKPCHRAMCLASEAKKPEQYRASRKAKWRRAIDERKPWYLRTLETRRSKAAALKDSVFAAYGGACACCGENEPEFLSVDHVNGDGAAHRKEIGIGRLYEWLKKHGFPREVFQVLCWNCNRAKSDGAECPHVTKARAVLRLVT